MIVNLASLASGFDGYTAWDDLKNSDSDLVNFLREACYVPEDRLDWLSHAEKEAATNEITKNNIFST